MLSRKRSLVGEPVQAPDADGDALTCGPTGNTLFRIDVDTGQTRVDDGEVTEPDATHAFTVGVSDATGASETVAVTIEVVEEVRWRPPTGGFGGILRRRPSGSRRECTIRPHAQRHRVRLERGARHRGARSGERDFAELFADGVPAVMPLIVKSEAP